MTKGPERDVTLQDVWDIMEFGKPETSTTLAEELPCHRDTVRVRLEELEEKGYIESKTVSARSKAWWKPAHNPEVVPEEIHPDTRSEKDPKITKTLAEAKRVGKPMTSSEIAEEINENQDTIYQRLNKLEELNWVDSLKTGATGKVWWLAEIESDKKGRQTTLSLSPVLKTELKRVRDQYEEPQKLEEALIFALKYPDVTDHYLEGDEDGIDPIKVSTSTLDHIRYLRDEGDYGDYEETIRDYADIAYREENMKAVTRSPKE